jgi:hypothetical protein
MSPYKLSAKTEAAARLASFFAFAQNAEVRLAIQEDKCFKENSWMDLGTLKLQPGEAEPGYDRASAFRSAVEYGFYEWHCTLEDRLVTKGRELLSIADDDPKLEEQTAKLARGLDGIAHCACRVGLIHPVIDAGTLSSMPFRTPTTIVADTSAIVQGGLDFAVRFLYPMARIKIPAIAHMELLKATDNFFRLRRKLQKGASARMFLEHALSQGGQRALLRLELQTDTEIERGRLGADPLRGVVQVGSDAEDRNLNLSVVQRSFADRLIFETARQHFAQSNQDHPVAVMTCDQGLARMTIAEGMQPLFFEAVKVERISDRILTGSQFHPFAGNIYAVPLTAFLWELAVTFGTASLTCESKGAQFEVSAIGSNLPWKPYHAREDLLWTRDSGFPNMTEPTQPGGKMPVPQVIGTGVAPKATAGKRSKQPPPGAEQGGVAKQHSRQYSGSYKFSPTRLLKLLEALSDRVTLTTSQALTVLDLKSKSQLEDYRNFLASGNFIDASGATLAKTSVLDDLWRALIIGDYSKAADLMLNVPSFRRFMDAVKAGSATSEESYSVGQRSLATYIAIAELFTVAMAIPDDRIYPTLNHPKPVEFAEFALKAYSALSPGAEDYVLTGSWLEALVREFGIHPVIAKNRLEEAQIGGYLQRYTEGSTPETGYGKHALYVLEMKNGKPVVRRVALFEGDFLIPGKSSVSIRLARGSQ